MLAGKSVVVTGAGRGIGREIALAMAQAGARVVVNDPGVDPRGEGGGSGEEAGLAAQVAAEIVSRGGEAVADAGSVSSWEDAQAMVGRAVDTFGRIDAVINNAGILRDALFHKMDPADFLAVLNVHLIGSFYVSRAAAPFFREQESGAYVHMTSTSGLIGNLGQANYAAAKLGIVGLSRSIAIDMARFNVRSNCISPFAWSRLTGTIPVKDEASQERVRRLQTMKPEQMAPLAVYLCADAASDVTGQIFVARGNELFLMSQPRPVRAMHTAEGWTPQTVAERVMPAFRASFVPLEKSADVFPWDPV